MGTRATCVRGILGTAFAGCLSIGVAHAATCASEREQLALQTRVLQSDLMVAALSCQHKESYNTFVRRFTDQLVAHGRELRGYFQRVYGSRGERQLNQFVTRLANDSSQRSLADAGIYCAETDQLFQQVLGLGPRELAGYVRARPASHRTGIQACTLQASNR